jgi:integrase
VADIFLPFEEKLRDAGFTSVSHVPVLFGRSAELPARRFLCREYGHYMRERALLEWVPSGRMTALEMARAGLSQKISFPTRRTLSAWAERLANFDDWIIETDRKWQDVAYTEDIVLGYQSDMLSGRWSRNGKGLMPETVKGRVTTACDFLTWASCRGYRPPFGLVAKPSVGKVSADGFVTGEQKASVSARAGLPSNSAKALIEIPNVQQIELWLASVLAKRGFTKALMCRFALKTAARKSEVVLFKLGDLQIHDPDNPRSMNSKTRPWKRIASDVQIILRHGTKGRRFDPVGSPTRGPERAIRISIDHARELIEYRDGRRLKAGLLFKRQEGRLPNQDLDNFFLSEFDGRAFSDDTFYRAWKVDPLPIKNWHPHNARDYWACTTLLRHLQREAKSVAAVKLGDMPDAWVSEVGRSFIQTVIRPQLGHLSEETTNTYLQWMSSQTMLGNYYESYFKHLENRDDQSAS